jgi:hypothetical protein
MSRVAIHRAAGTLCPLCQQYCAHPKLQTMLCAVHARNSGQRWQKVMGSTDGNFLWQRSSMPWGDPTAEDCGWDLGRVLQTAATIWIQCKTAYSNSTASGAFPAAEEPVLPVLLTVRRCNSKSTYSAAAAHEEVSQRIRH